MLASTVTVILSIIATFHNLPLKLTILFITAAYHNLLGSIVFQDRS